MIKSMDEAQQYMDGLATKGSILGLDRMERLVSLTDKIDGGLKVIHIAGTNGKGSTSCFIESILNKAGYRTGMYYSPAICGIKDHYRINGELITDDMYLSCLNEAKNANERLMELEGESATVFEIETLMAFYLFYMCGCDFAIVETGLGGRLDATNVSCYKKILAVITSISFDHMAVLGDTLEKIAGEKAGIITSKDMHVVALDSGDEAVSVIQNKCRSLGAAFTVVNKSLDYSEDKISYGEYKDLEISLEGDFQKDNARLAIATINELIAAGQVEISNEAVEEGLKNAYWPYRFEKICDKPVVYVDGAHNESAAELLRNTIRRSFYERSITLILGMFKDKEYEKIIGLLAPLADRIYTITTFDENRALSARLIKEVADKYCDQVIACDSLDEAVNRISCDTEDIIIACGSLSYLSAFKEKIDEMFN